MGENFMRDISYYSIIYLFEGESQNWIGGYSIIYLFERGVFKTNYQSYYIIYLFVVLVWSMQTQPPYIKIIYFM